MYKKPAPVASTSKRTKKEDKSRKTDNEKPMSSPKKPKEVDKPLPKVSPKTKEAKEKPVPVESPPIQPAIVTTIETNPITEVANQSTVTLEPMEPVVRPQLVNSSINTVNSSIVETRPANEIPSAIKFRISYSKTPANCSDSFKIPTTPNTRDGCANCQHTRNADKLNGSVSTTSSSELPIMANNNREEFYKYLRIDTNPSQEKTSPEPSPTDTLYNHRRSLRVFIQQRQYEFTKTTVDKKDDKSPDKARLKSPSAKSNSPNAEVKGDDEFAGENAKTTNSQAKTPENGKLMKRDEQSNGSVKPLNLIPSNIKQRRSYEPSPTEQNVPNSSSNLLKETENMECDENAAEGTSNGEGSSAVVKSRVVRVPKRKIILPSPMMLTEMFKRYKQCFRQGFAVRQHMRQQTAKRPKKRLSNTMKPPEQLQNVSAEQIVQNDVMHLDDIQPTCEELMNTFSPTSITHSNASTDSAIVVNSHINELNQPKITLTSSNSTQWQQELAKGIDKSQFRNPLDPKHGAVLAILTHSTSSKSDDVIVVVQQSQISYWYSTSKTLSMFGIARYWTKIGDIQRIDEGRQ